MRDLDLDRPPEAYVQALQPGGWLKVVSVLLAQQGTVEMQSLSGDTAALRALQMVLPASAQSLLTSLRDEVQAGKDLRHVLRAQRRTADPALMAVCDGWRVLSRAAQLAVCDATAESIAAYMRDLPLDAPRKWAV